MPFTKELSEEIRQKSDIVTVISNFIPLTRKGKNFIGVCPFHNDSTPSLTVSPEKQIYKCFACNAAGNSITFVKEYEKISFFEALTKVADICGIQLPKDHVRPIKKVNPELEPLHQVLKETLLFYNYSLKTSEGVLAENYLIERKLTKDIINTFEIGYAPKDSTSTQNYLRSKSHSMEAMVKSGVMMQSASGFVDPMHSRVVFPIHDFEGHVVGFSGRRLGNSEEAKYVNSSETKVFHKSQCLFNYHRCEKSARRDGYLYVVEGFMDAIALHRAGYLNVVATMGTATSQEHAQAFRRLNVEIRIALDFDDAGQTATMKMIDVLSPFGIKMKVVAPPETDLDADEILNQLGQEKLKEIYEKLLSPMDFRIQYFERKTNLQNYQERQGLAVKLIGLVEKEIENSLDQEHYLRLISSKTGFSVDSIRRMMKQPVNRRATTNSAPISYAMMMKDLKYYEKIERELVTLMLRNQSLVKQVEEDINYEFYDEVSRQIVFYLYNMKGDKIEIPRLISDIENPQVQGFLGNLIDYEGVDYSPEAFKRLMENHQISIQLVRQIDELFSQSLAEKDVKKKAELLKQISKLKHELMQVKRK